MSDLTQRIAALPHDRLVLLNARLQERLQEQEARQSEPIAVVGAACRFAQAPTLDAYWQLLSEGRQSVTEVPPERWDLDTYYSPNPDDDRKMYSRHGSFLENVDQFDYQFFNIARREVLSMDPQQRILLEICWEALERGGQAGRHLEGSATGVFVGVAASSYTGAVTGINDFDAYAGTGNSLCVAAGRISHVFGLTGPSVALDTSCSSSLVALDLACHALRDRQCNMALAGGVNLTLMPEVTIYFCKFKAISKSGACHTFDAAADGYVRGEGAGIVVLKRLSDAVQSGDRILAIIRGSAVGHDGRTSGLTVPNRQAQAEVIRRALRNARLQPAEVQYLEAHGTGTALGDPIELRALGDVFGGEERREPLLIGSVKTNIGHTESAAGVASLIKVLLALEHRQIPAHLNFRNPNPFIPWNELPVEVPTALTPWSNEQGPRTAGISSFGFSGTNAHLVVQEYLAPTAAEPSNESGAHPLCISARSGAALSRLAADMAEAVERSSEPLAAICHTLLRGRRHFQHRRAASVASKAEAVATLRRWASEAAAPPTSGTPRSILLIPPFDHRASLGRRLQQTLPQYRQLLDECRERIEARAQQLDHLSTAEGSGSREASLFDAMARLALVELLNRWEFRPTAVCGWGGSEPIALLASGQIAWDEAIDRLLDAWLAEAPTACVEIGDPRSSLVDAATGQVVRKAPWQYSRRLHTSDVASGELSAPLADHLQQRGYDLVLVLGGALELAGSGVQTVHAIDAASTTDDVLLAQLLACLYRSGCELDWREVCGTRYPIVPLPTHPFEREPCWRDPRASGIRPKDEAVSTADTQATPQAGDAHPLLGQRMPGPPSQETFCMRRDLLPACMQRSELAAQALITLLAAARRQYVDNRFTLDLSLLVPRGTALDAQIWTSVQRGAQGDAALEWWHCPADAGQAWQQLASARALPSVEVAGRFTAPSVLRARCTRELSGSQYYEQAASELAQRARVVDRVWTGDNAVVALLRLAEQELPQLGALELHPYFLQAALGFIPQTAEVHFEQAHMLGCCGPLVWCCIEPSSAGGEGTNISLFTFQEELVFSATLRPQGADNVSRAAPHASAAQGAWKRNGAAARQSKLPALEIIEQHLQGFPTIELGDAWAEIDRACRDQVIASLKQLGPFDPDLPAVEWCRRAGVQPRFAPWIDAIARQLRREQVAGECDVGFAAASQPVPLLHAEGQGEASLAVDVVEGARLALDRSTEFIGQYLRGRVAPDVESFEPETFLSGSGKSMSAAAQTAARQFLSKILGHSHAAPWRVLELNAALGTMTEQALPLLDGCHYTASDASPLLLSLCQRRLGSHKNLGYSPGDLHEQPAAGEQHGFDIAVCFTSWYLADSPAQLLELAARRLAIGGVLILALPTGDTPWLDLHFALSQIGLRSTNLALSPGHGIDGDWQQWCSAAGFSRPTVFAPCSGVVPKSLLIAQLERAPAEVLSAARPSPARWQEQFDFWRSLWESDERQYERLLLDRMRHQLASVLNNRSAEQIDPGSLVSQLGLDSLMMLDLQRRSDPVQRWMAPPLEVWAGQSLKELAAHWARAARACRNLALAGSST